MPIELIDGTLVGHLTGTQTVSGSISGTGSVSGSITIGGSGDYPEYTGSYDVIPALTEQILDTGWHVMTSDVTVREIPITYTSNPQDGQTVLIG